MGVTVLLSVPLSKSFSRFLLQKLSWTGPLKTVMKMITIQPMAHAVKFWHLWLNQLHEKCLIGVKVQNSPYQQCRAVQVMSLFWFSSSILHFLSYSSTILHNTTLPTHCISFRWHLPLHSSWVTQDHFPEKKGITVPSLGFDAGDESRLLYQRQKRRKAMFEMPHSQLSSQDMWNLCAQGRWQFRRMKC